MEIQRGERAALLLQDELLRTTLDTIKREYTEKWQSCPVRDKEGQLMLLLMVKTVQKFETELEAVLNTGKIARATLAQRLGEKLNPFS